MKSMKLPHSASGQRAAGICSRWIGKRKLPERRFPHAPDTKLGQDCFIVRDANGQALATSISRLSRDAVRLPSS